MPDQHKSPFKFLDSYTRADSHIFYGRDKEVDEIYSKVFQSKLLLVYGASGTGKSSIINCGLANKFNDSDWFPIQIRRGGNIRKSLFNQIQKNALNKVELSSEEQLSNVGLQKVLNSVFLDHFKPIYLIFDQFEELFVFGFKDEWQQFISSVRYIMNMELDVRFIFIIRGEYLEFLSEFEELIPEFFDNRVRVEKMTRLQAQQSISGPSKQFSIEIEPGFEEKLIKKLSPEQTQVELTFLQVFLDRIYRSSIETSGGQAVKFENKQIDQIGQIGDILAEFVDEQLFKMNDPKAALAVLKSFVSLQGTKVQRNTEEVRDYISDLAHGLDRTIIEDILTQFVNKRILKEKDDNGRYELRHDSLALKIYEKITHQERELLDIKQFLTHSLNEYQKRGILLNDEDLTYIAPHERKLSYDENIGKLIALSRKKSKKQRQRRKTLMIVSVIILGLLLTSIAGFIYSQKQKALAESMAKQAEQQSLEANNQRHIAENQKRLAEQNELEAKRQTELAKVQEDLAMQSKAVAQKNAVIAIEQSKIAEEQKTNAEEAKKLAEANQEEALWQRDIAEQQSSVAYRLRMLSLAKEIAYKSAIQQDPQVQALLSLCAYNFHKEMDGSRHQSEIATAMLGAIKKLSPDKHKKIKLYDGSVIELEIVGNEFYTISSGGKLSKIESIDWPPVAEVLLDTKLNFLQLSFDSSNNLLLIGSSNGHLIGFSTITNEIIFEEKIHDAEISGILPYKSGYLVTGHDGKLSIVNADGAISSQINLNSKIRSLDVDQVSGTIFLGMDNDQIIELNVDLEVKKKSLALEGRLMKIKLIDNSQFLLAGYVTGAIAVIDTNAMKIVQLLPGHRAAITSLDYNSKSQLIVSSSFDRSIRIWDFNELQKQPIVIYDEESWIMSAAFDQHGQFVLIGSADGGLRKYPLRFESMASDLCENIERNLTEEEWKNLIATDIPYQKICDR